MTAKRAIYVLLTAFTVLMLTCKPPQVGMAQAEKAKSYQLKGMEIEVIDSPTVRELYEKALDNDRKLDSSLETLRDDSATIVHQLEIIKEQQKLLNK